MVKDKLASSEIEKVSSFIPLDKSWIIRMGILDFINGYSDIFKLLENERYLGGDLEVLPKVIRDFSKKSSLIDVGESGTIYRFVSFYIWKNKIPAEIKLSKTLVERVARGAITNNPEIVNFSAEQLLELDNQTSQWATMAYLLGDRKKVKNPPYKLQVTYDAVESWENARKNKKSWEARIDPTIFNQALAFVEFLKTEKINFKPEQAEDYCFARAFNILTQDQAKILYPSLEGHETPRFEEMEKSIKEAESGKVSSKDHRVVQAIAMKYFPKFTKENFVTPDCVNKTWPRFWDFIEYCKREYV
ncbi:Uncharacterised protein [uncultured archaeon]|nr:Uncharacterised protein [uncultured archaeon]